jgi:hypothetical protein
MKHRLHNMTGQVFHVVARVNGQDVNRSIPSGGSLVVDEMNPMLQALVDRKRFVCKSFEEETSAIEPKPELVPKTKKVSKSDPSAAE